MKDYGRLLGTAEGRSRSPPGWSTSTSGSPSASTSCRQPTSRSTVIVQDPCHLRHVQRVHGAVRTVLGRVADIVELDDDGLCCGAGGAYSALQPALAGEIRERKLAAIDDGRRPLRRRRRRQRQPWLRDAPRRGRGRRATSGRHRRRGDAPMSRYEDLADRLEAIVGELDELSFDLLQQAIADGATQRPAADRSLTQARRAVEKAAGLLRQLAEPDV